MTRDVGAVKVNSGDHLRGRVIQSGRAEDAVIGADVGAHPVAGEVKRIGDEDGLPCVESNVSAPEARAADDDVDLDVELKVIGEIVAGEGGGRREE